LLKFFRYFSNLCKCSLNNKIISRRNTVRTYNYGWVRVVQKEETTHFYKKTGETISIKNYIKGTEQKIVLNGQKVNQATSQNRDEEDSVCYMDYINHIDKSKSITKKLNDTYTFNECSKYLSDTWKNWTQKNLLFSEIGKFSEPVNGVRTLEFNS
jgi:GDP-D-mannose dehydratase